MPTIHTRTSLTRKRIGCVVSLLLVMALSAVPAAGAVTFDVPQVDVAKLIVVDTGQVLFEKGADEPRPPASLAKMMTMLLTLEAIERGEILADDLVRVSRRASSIHGSKVWLAEGDRLTVEQLLWAVAIQSANDASIALAEHVAGTEEAFVARMNQRAQTLGLEHSHFANSHGLPDANIGDKPTVMSASDALKLGRELVTRFPQVLEWTGVWNKPLGPGTRNPITLENTNRLVLTSSLGVDGLKTGYTNEAGYQLVATAEDNGLRLMSVVMGAKTAEDRYDATERLLRWGFTAFERLEIGADDTFTARIPDAVNEAVVKPVEPIVVLAPRHDLVELHTEVVVYDSVKAPVEAGEIVGEVVVWIDGEVAGRTTVAAVDDVARAGFFRRLWINVVDWVSGLFAGGEAS